MMGFLEIQRPEHLYLGTRQRDDSTTFDFRSFEFPNHRFCLLDRDSAEKNELKLLNMLLNNAMQKEQINTNIHKLTQ